MADQGKWFKLWCSSLDDTRLEDLELNDWARWIRLGVYIKKHGNNGELKIANPCRTLQNILRIPSYSEILWLFLRLPNLMISDMPLAWPHGKLRPPKNIENILCGKWCTDGRGSNWAVAVVDTPHEEVVKLWEMKRCLFVSFINWHKYQDDLSSERVVKLRLNETLQEEKRSRREVEEKRNIPPTPHKVFIKPTPELVKAYGLSIGYKIDGHNFCDHYESKGWLVGKTPMKDWQAAVRTWRKSAPMSDMIRPPKEREPEPLPEDLPSPEEIREYKEKLNSLVVGLGRRMP